MRFKYIRVRRSADEHVRAHRLADLGNRRLDQLELHAVAPVTVVVVVIVGEYRQVDEKESGGAERQE